MAVKALPFQKQGVRRIEEFGGRALLADVMGLGKTLQAIWALRRNPAWWPVVIVCPGVAKYHWAHEIARDMGRRAFVAVGRDAPRNIPRGMPPIMVINYDILPHWAHFITRKFCPSTVIFDECHYMINRETNRTAAGYDIATMCDQVMGISGTPVVNRPKELFPILNMINPFAWPSRIKYLHRYCQPKRRPWGTDYNGAARLPELHQKLVDTLMIRRRKEDVMDELPPKRRHIVSVPLTPRGREEYDKANRDFIPWLRKAFGAGRAAKAARAERMVRMGYMKRLAARYKAKAIVDWAQGNIEEHGKLVLFAEHKKMVKTIGQHIGRKHVTIGGGQGGTQEDRAAYVRQFQNDGATECFLGTRAATTAITLTAAHQLAFAEPWWRPGDHDQAEDRVHRITQTMPCDIYYLVAPRTIEVDVTKVLGDKRLVTGGILDGVDVADFDIYEEVTKALLMQ